MIRNRIMLGILLFTSFVPLIFIGGKVPYVIFFSVLLLPIISVGYTCMQYFLLKINQVTLNKEVLKGESLDYFAHFRNKGPFFCPYLKVIFNGNQNIFYEQFKTTFISINPFSKESLTFNLVFKYRGVYSIGIKAVEIEDFLGVFKLRYRFNEVSKVTVLPRVIKLKNFFLKSDFICESDTNSNSCIEEISAISDIRKYVYGDSFKKIHWKLSSKMGELMSKNYHPTLQTEVAILLDLKKCNLSILDRTVIEDKIIESAIAVIYYCLSVCTPVKLIFYQEYIKELRGKTLFDFDNFYNSISTIPFDENICLGNIIDVYTNENNLDSNIIIITADLGFDLFNRIHKYTSFGNNLSLIYICPKGLSDKNAEDTEKILNFLSEINVNIYIVNAADKINSILESLYAG